MVLVGPLPNKLRTVGISLTYRLYSSLNILNIRPLLEVLLTIAGLNECKGPTDELIAPSYRVAARKERNLRNIFSFVPDRSSGLNLSFFVWANLFTSPRSLASSWSFRSFQSDSTSRPFGPLVHLLSPLPVLDGTNQPSYSRRGLILVSR